MLKPSRARAWQKDYKVLVESLEQLRASESAKVYPNDVVSLKQRALDLVNRCSLSNNAVYRQIEQLQPTRQRVFAESDFRQKDNEHLVGFLTTLQERLILLPQLCRLPRRNLRSRKAFRLPKENANSIGRARTVALIFERLKIASLSDGLSLQKVKQQDAEFAAILERIWKPPKLEGELGKAVNRREKLRLAKSLTADYHGKTLSTIETDWKDHKPTKYRREP